MPIDEGEKLTTDFLAMHRAFEPLLCFVARQSRQRELAIDGAPRQLLAPLGRLGVRRLGAERHRDEQTLMLELLTDVLEHVPRGDIGPLHLVEQKNERATSAATTRMYSAISSSRRYLLPHREPVGDDVARQSGHEVMQLAPWSRWSVGESMQCGDERRPNAVRLANAMLARAANDE